MNQSNANDSAAPMQTDLLGRFARHKVAANLLMILMLLAGLYALQKLNRQFLPTFALDVVSVRVVWPGASAEDVESSVTAPLERELRDVNQVKRMSSTTSDGISSVTLEFYGGTNMGTAVDEVKERVDLVRNLPSTAERPEVTLVVRNEPIARIAVTTDGPIDELRPLVRQFERELIARGVADVVITGLPEEEVAIQVPMATAVDLGLSLDQIGDRVGKMSRDIPAGEAGDDSGARALRGLEQRRSALDFENLTLRSGRDGELLRLGDIAQIEERPKRQETRVRFDGKPAVEMMVMRTESADALDSADIMHAWAKTARPKLPQGVQLEIFDENWTLIWERLMLLVKNGAGGLLLVLAILFVFLNGRVAFWVAVGIPTSFLATLAVLYAIGGSINMVSMFALIMALGIIVDDAIVVGEDAQAHYDSGEAPLRASEGAARRMLAPVFSSSLTTIAAFLPLMLVGGMMGNILFDIPLIIVCVILASLVECFLILPGHLRHSFVHQHKVKPESFRARFDRRFNTFRDGRFRNAVRWALSNRGTTLAAIISSLILAVGLLAGGRIGFTFFPMPEGDMASASISFVSGTPEQTTERYAESVRVALHETEQHFGGSLIRSVQTQLGRSSSNTNGSIRRGDAFATIDVQLVPFGDRDVRLSAFIEEWRTRVPQAAGLERVTIAERKHGPPGTDIELRLVGKDPRQLKAAIDQATAAMRSLPGVTTVEDDMPWGKEQLIYKLTALGETLGLTVEEVGRQLRAAYDGHLLQIFTRGDDEIEVRVILPEEERSDLASLGRLAIVLKDGSAVPLSDVLQFRTQRGFDVLRHAEGELAATMLAEVDTDVSKVGELIAILQRDVIPQLQEGFGVRASFEGKNADERDTLSDMRTGLFLALALIYLVLAWVFSSYGWPLVVMSTIPFGLVGALFGHWLLGLDLTILSLFGLFGLSGILVNDSIILVTFFRRLREQGMSVQDALVEAAVQRLRAVILTSLTTIAGLLPLLFETSLQAQFLIPMAVSLSFGLAYATVLVLFLVPVLLSLFEGARRRAQALLPQSLQLTQ